MHFNRQWAQCIGKTDAYKLNRFNTCSMQIKYDLCSLLQENKTIDINVVRKSCEVRAATMISKAKVWNPFTKGKQY